MEQPRNIEAELLEEANRKIMELSASLKKERQARELAESKKEVIKAAADLMGKLEDKMVEEYENTISKLQDENNALRKQIEQTNHKAAVRIAKGIITNEVFTQTYDHTKTDRQIASEMGVSDRTANSHRKANNIPSKPERTRQAFADYFDDTLTNAQMLAKMEEIGYKISLATLKRLKRSIWEPQKRQYNNINQ